MRSIITNDELNKFRLVGPDFQEDKPSEKSSFANNLNLTISDIFIYQILSQFSAKSPFLLSSESETKREKFQEDLPLDVSQEFQTTNAFQRLMSNLLNYLPRFNNGDYDISLCYPLESEFKIPDYYYLLSSDEDYEEIINKGTDFQATKLVSCFRKQIPSIIQKEWYEYAWKNLVLHLLKDEITFGIDWKLVNPLIACNYSELYDDIKNKWVNLSAYTIDDFKTTIRSKCNATNRIPYSFSGYDYYKLTRNELSDIPIDYALPTLKYIENTSEFLFNEKTNLSDDVGRTDGYVSALGNYFDERDFAKDEDNLKTLSIGLDYDYDDEKEVVVSVDNICGMKNVVLSGYNPRPYAWRNKINRDFDNLDVDEIKLPYRLVDDNYQSLKLIAKDYYDSRKMLAANDNNFTVKHMCNSPLITITYYGEKEPNLENPEKMKLILTCDVNIDYGFWEEINEDNAYQGSLTEQYLHWLNSLSGNCLLVDRQGNISYDYPLPLYYQFGDVTDYFGDRNYYYNFFSNPNAAIDYDSTHKWIHSNNSNVVTIIKSPDCNSNFPFVRQFYNDVYFPTIKSLFPKSSFQIKQDKLYELMKEFERRMSEATTEEERDEIERWVQEEQRKIEQQQYEIELPESTDEVLSVLYWWKDEDDVKDFYRYSSFSINCCVPKINELCSNGGYDEKYGDNLGEPIDISASTLRTAPTTSYPVKELVDSISADYVAFDKFHNSRYVDVGDTLSDLSYTEISEFNNPISVAFEDSWCNNLDYMLGKLRKDSNYFKSTPNEFAIPEEERRKLENFILDGEEFELNMVEGMNQMYVPYFRDTGRTGHLYVQDVNGNFEGDYDYAILEVAMAPRGTPIEDVIFDGSFYNYDFGNSDGYIKYGPTSRTFKLEPSDELFTDPNQLSGLLSSESLLATTANKQFVEVDLKELCQKYQ